MKIKELIKFIREKYNFTLYDIKTLIKQNLNVDSAYLIIHEDDEINEEEILEMCEQIKKGKPLQYVTHIQEFYGLNFYVDENVLIPQPDTEILVDEAINKMNKEKNNLKVLDLCTGSGAIAISIKNELKEKVEVVASDISEKAIEVAKKNAKKIVGENGIRFVKSDMFNQISEEKFDYILSNPPYIRTDVIKKLDIDVQNEPHLALDGGKDGLEFYRIIRKNIDKYLKKNGTLMMEIGYDQKDDLLELFEGAVCIKDFAENDRVIVYKNV